MVEQSPPFPSIAPVHFLTVHWECRHFPLEGDPKKLVTKPYLLPNLTALCLEEEFAEVYLGWNEEALVAAVKFQWPASASSFPNVVQGDAFELFINTRPGSAVGYNTRFCHHFAVLLQPVDGKQAFEMTRFRTEDAHPLCDPALLGVDVQQKGRHHLLFLKIPAAALHGYDPQQSDQLGFTYRVDRADASAQHFSVCGRDFPFEQLPGLWSTARLVS